jgi:hypothetical protein
MIPGKHYPSPDGILCPSTYLLILLLQTRTIDRASHAQVVKGAALLQCLAFSTYTNRDCLL